MKTKDWKAIAEKQAELMSLKDNLIALFFYRVPTELGSELKKTIRTKTEELSLLESQEVEGVTDEDIEKQLHLKLSEIKIDKDNLDYCKANEELCGKLRWDLVDMISNYIQNLNK
jgi:hypothetical protein